MKVELSPWENLELSSISSRRRRKPGSSSKAASDSEENELPPRAALSFVTSIEGVLRPAKKARRTKLGGGRNTSIQPYVVVTTENRIVVVEKAESPDGSSYEESQLLQYASRPRTSFLPSKSGVPGVPALLDQTHDRLYALQKDNQHLLSWSTTSSPDETRNTTVFDSPVLTMSLLERQGRSTVYGTLGDNSLFVASCPAGGKEIESKTIATNVPDGVTHVGTVAHSQSGSSTDSKGRKRVHFPENDGVHDSHGVCIFQIFASKTNLIVIRYETLGLSTSELDNMTSVQTSVALGARFEGKDIESASMIGTISDEHEQSALLRIRIHGELVALVLSFSSGALLRTSYKLPSDSKHFSLVNGVMSVSSSTELFLLDAKRGALLERRSMKDLHVVDGNNVPVALATNSKSCSVALVLETKEGSLSLAMGSLNVTRRFRLSDAIASARGKESLRPQNVVGGGSLLKEKQVADSEHAQVQRALNLLKTADNFVRTSEPIDIPENFLLDGFLEVANGLHLGKQMHQNPQESITLNGVHKKNGLSGGTANGSNGEELKKPKSSASGEKSKRATCQLQQLPMTFLNEAAFLMANLCVARGLSKKHGVLRNAHGILKDIIRTKVLNARIFQRGGLGASNFISRIFSSMDSCPSDSTPSYSSVELAFDLLWCCKDVSEGQMVSMVHFILSAGTSGEFARVLVQYKKKLDLSDTIIASCKKCMSLQKAEKLSPSEQSIQKTLASKLTLEVVSMLMKEIINYSDLNGALLRRGMAESFSRKELLVLARVLLKFVSQFGASSKATRRLLHIMSAVCDSLRAFSPLTGEETVTIEVLQKKLKEELSFTQILAPLQATLRGLSEVVKADKMAKVSEGHNVGSSSMTVAEYQIERLVL
eukprot:CAMPEP_0172446810 /NCGR_PEP_ID=MMETSP1065-20121228/6306_1 /TAXON_ID=265537 /ORGANISM="Amphiprora paludosa, Strain CCMP125" /LENGTH=882 /DNA_ID=CAMNT_0013197999 /DNA_START=38 /DNA_END=2686 /DNA_ORIENTATION=+